LARANSTLASSRPAEKSGCVSCAPIAQSALGALKQARQHPALVAEVGADRDARVVRRRGDADLRVGGRHRPLRGSDIGPALEDVGRDAERHRRRRQLADVGNERERRRRRSGQRRDRVLERPALAAQHVELGQRRVEQRLLLGDVEPRGGAEVVPGADEIERAALQRDRARQHVELDVDRAQVEVGGREVGAEQEAGVLEVGRRLLGAGAERLRPSAGRGRRGRTRS
jgi:hypothetical protein